MVLLVHEGTRFEKAEEISSVKDFSGLGELFHNPLPNFLLLIPLNSWEKSACSKNYANLNWNKN